MAWAARVLRRWALTLGPGLITGAADDDPSGISTYAIAGAAGGYSLLWTALFTAPMMAVVEGMCARIALVRRCGLTQALVQRFPRPVVSVLVAIVVVANTANIGADLAGMAAATQLVLPKVPVMLWAPAFAIGIVLVEVYFSYRAFANVVKWLCLSLLAYVVTAFIVHINWKVVLIHVVVPRIHLDHAWMAMLLGILGTTITPYLFFWQSAMEVEERSRKPKGVSLEVEVADATIDVNTGAMYSNVIMFFIIVTTAATLGAHGIGTISSAADAASALQPFAGRFAGLIFALGIVGAGLLAVPVLAGSSAYVVAEIAGWREGLALRPSQAPGFYVVIASGVALGLAIPSVFHVDPIKALFWCAIGNGIAAVPLLIAITIVASDRAMMGRFANSVAANIWAWLTVALMGIATLALFVR